MFKIIGADGREYGPVETAQLRAWIKEGRVDGKTLALIENGTEWKPLSAFPEFTFVAAAAPPTLTAPPGVTPQLMRANGFAIAGMILGILSLTLCFCCYGFPCNLLAFIFSLIALSQIKQNPNVYTGRSMAITGLVLSLVSFGLAICFILSGSFFELWNPERIQRELNLH
jgi:hypothetical protein